MRDRAPETDFVWTGVEMPEDKAALAALVNDFQRLRGMPSFALFRGAVVATLAMHERERDRKLTKASEDSIRQALVEAGQVKVLAALLKPDLGIFDQVAQRLERSIQKEDEERMNDAGS